MSAEANKALVRREVELLNAHDLARIGAFFTEHCAADWRYKGPRIAGVEQLLAALLVAFPDGQYTIEDLLAVDDKVILRWSWSGTQRGEFLGIAPTAKRVTTSGITIHQLVDGKYVASWEEWDMASFFQQLGAAPAHSPA